VVVLARASGICKLDDATGNVSVNEATVVQADVQASNGVIHAVNQVLLPPDVQL
jgi:uncharacterized surface protein with fasciclin (FAS1) repeats